MIVARTAPRTATRTTRTLACLAALLVFAACSSAPTAPPAARARANTHAAFDCSDSAFSGYSNPGGHC